MNTFSAFYHEWLEGDGLGGVVVAYRDTVINQIEHRDAGALGILFVSVVVPMLLAHNYVATVPGLADQARRLWAKLSFRSFS